MTAFATAAASLRSDPNGSEAGTFRPQTAPNVYGAEDCRLQFNKGSDPQRVGDLEVWNPGVHLVLYHDGLSRAPERDDRVTARSVLYRVTAIRSADPLQHWSHCDVDPV